MVTFTPSAQQDQAIQCQSNMVIVARPGSGKTSVLSRKVRNLVSKLRPHQGIIAISFTNKASDELEHRCKAEAFDAKNSFFGTIDDFCLREIIFPFTRQLMPVAAKAKAAKISELPEPVKRMLPAMPIQSATFVDIYTFLPFLQASLAQGYVPLEAVGLLAYHVIDRSPACQKYLVARYRAVFIDEYQDSGYFQHQIFLKLKALGLISVAVGDGDQSIYAFAHKDSRYLLRLTAPGSGFFHFVITTNFRSHPSISDFALRLLDSSYLVAPTNDNRVFIKTINGSQDAISTWLQTAVPHLMGYYQVASADRVAVLCRHQHSARLIAAHLGLDCHLVEESPFETSPVAEASLFSDLLRLRYDLQLTAEPLIERAGSLKLSSLERRALRRAVLRCRTCAEHDLVSSVMNAAARLLGQPPSSTAAIALESVCGDAGKLRWFHPPSRDAIQIMTLHKAKGLEFDLVFHADLYDHVIPKRIYPPGTFGQVIFENEKQCLNLHYVGVTRAVKACVLMTSTLRINGQGEVKSAAPSQLIGRNGASATPIPW
jgi:DNA helicase-2/ATP-dependent DNA helicase PcrA